MRSISVLLSIVVCLFLTSSTNALPPRAPPPKIPEEDLALINLDDLDLEDESARCWAVRSRKRYRNYDKKMAAINAEKKRLGLPITDPATAPKPSPKPAPKPAPKPKSPPSKKPCDLPCLLKKLKQCGKGPQNKKCRQAIKKQIRQLKKKKKNPCDNCPKGRKGDACRKKCKEQQKKKCAKCPYAAEEEEEEELDDEEEEEEYEAAEEEEEEEEEEFDEEEEEEYEAAEEEEEEEELDDAQYEEMMADTQLNDAPTAYTIHISYVALIALASTLVGVVALALVILKCRNSQQQQSYKPVVVDDSEFGDLEV